MNLRRTQKGFTLIELILTVGLITTIITGIYITYNKKRMDSNVQLQSQYLERIEKNLNSIFINTNNYATLNNTLVNSLRFIPSELEVSPGVFKNLLGGDMNFMHVPPAILGINGYTIQLGRLTTEACVKIATSNFGYKAPLVRVNNVAVKTANTSFTPTNITAISAACATSNNNIVDFSSFSTNATNLAIPSATPVIPKQTSTIPTVGDIVTSGTPACTGGAVWNSSFCACPAGRIWTGSACMVLDSNAASCRPGWGWNGTACAALPATEATFLRYGTPPPGVNPTTVTPTIAGSVTAPAGATAGNRYVPSMPIPPIQVNTTTIHPTAANCTASGGNWDGRVCNYCPDAPMAVVKDSSNNNIPLSPAPKNVRSVWDGFRCVTPTTNW